MIVLRIFKLHAWIYIVEMLDFGELWDTMKAEITKLAPYCILEFLDSIKVQC